MTSEAKTDPLVELCHSAQGAWVATVVSVGAAPAAWSGRAAAYQAVTYTVKQTLKGPVTIGQIVVRHLVVKSSPSAEAGDVPQLSKQLFHAGAALVVIAEKNDAGEWLCLDERIGVAEATAEWISKVRAACK